MKIRASVEEITLQNDNGRDVESVTATCSRCSHTTESFGTGENSVLRCLVLLREECPRNERNFYVDETE
jgi:hypothetical protein